MKANPDEASLWMECLPNDAKLEFLDDQFPSRTDLIQYVATKNDPRLEQLALRSCSLAIDIEYNPDVEKLWEIGTATWKTKSLLLSRNEESSSLPDAIKVLGQEIGRSKLVVGHNILLWDWPILAPLLPETEQPILWDTLLVAFMLEATVRIKTRRMLCSYLNLN
jgi:hypothetical protein